MPPQDDGRAMQAWVLGMLLTSESWISQYEVFRSQK